MTNDLSAAQNPVYVVTLTCPDRIGIVADVSCFLADHGCNILESAQFGDLENGRFFLRASFAAPVDATLDGLRTDFAPIAAKHEMAARFHDQRARVRAIIMVSRFGHCLNDLLFRWKIGALSIDVKAIVSNHRDFADLAGAHGIPFHYAPVTQETKAQQELEVGGMIDHDKVELVILARYMQVLSTAFCARYPGRIINIHHSFLPSFKGAKPYHRAHERGVKLIGATAHYVTEDLDEGPIIEQSVERVAHSLSADDFVAVGRDVESLVLARAVKWHAEHRILVNGNRTIIFQ